jgi:hypothetical protein
MSRPCRVLGCTGHATQFGNWCPAHKSAMRRHGHPEQRAVGKAELKPFVARVRRRIEKNAESPVWHHAEERWRAVIEHARGIVAEAARGVPGFGYERRAAEEVVKLSDEVEARVVMETAFGLYLQQAADPRRFRSDEAFRFQLVRRIRGLAESNTRQWGDPVLGRSRRALGELPPRAASTLARWLVEAFGSIGLYLARLEDRDREVERARAADFDAALKDLI